MLFYLLCLFDLQVIIDYWEELVFDERIKLIGNDSCKRVTHLLC